MSKIKHKNIAYADYNTYTFFVKHQLGSAYYNYRSMFEFILYILPDQESIDLLFSEIESAGLDFNEYFKHILIRDW
jgi:hypothetical protein